VKTKPKTTKPVRLDLPLAEHHALRVAAAKAGLTMTEFVRGLVRKAIAGDTK
jgi:hypothetical protein